MITGKLGHWRARNEMRQFREALNFLERALLEQLPDGKYEIQGALMFALVSTYETRSSRECRFESHRKYLDIQCLIRGHEQIWVTDTSNLSITEPYVDEKDVCFFAPPKSAHRLEMEPGDFAVLFPEDGHMPGIAAGEPGEARKVVLKIDISAL